MATFPALELRRGTVEMFNNTKASSFPLFANIHTAAYPLSEGFDSLADLIASYTLIMWRLHFVIVPGPLDLAVNS